MIRFIVLFAMLFGAGNSEICWAGKMPPIHAPHSTALPKGLLKFSDKPVHRHPANALTLTLKDAYLAALKQSETINIQQELLIQANEVDSQAFGAMLPTISGTALTLRQPSSTSPTGSSISPSQQDTVKLSLSQPLFRGFRDFAVLRQKKDLVGAQYFNLLNAARQLFYELSTAYYNVLAYQQDEENYIVEIKDNVKRLGELEQFYKIGRSRLTDVLTFQSSIASLQNQLENTRGQIAVAREVLSYLTGWSHDFNLKNDEPLTSQQVDLDKYLDRIEHRADVQAALANAAAYAEGIPIASGAHLPSVDLTGNYFFARPGLMSNVNWDAQLALTIPIYQGGLIQAQVRQAQSVAHQSSLVLSQVRRLATQEIRTFYSQLDADQKQVAKLSELVEISQTNYETEVKYYRNGLVTNLDVIQAMTTYEGAQRLLDRQRFSVLLDRAKLEAATGGRPEIYLESTLKLPKS